MQRMILPGTDLTVTRFAFGTASLHHLGGPSAQVEHLRAAAYAGFSHFDTAPLYGFGASERALGDAFGDGTGAGISIATKVGLYPPGGASQSRRMVLARKGLGRVLPSLSSARADWSVARARQSLDDSLRRLRRCRVELLLIHEPDLACLNHDAWLCWMEAEVSAGRVGAFGLAGPPRHLQKFVAVGSPLGVVLQAQDSITGREANILTELERRPQITYGYLSAASATDTADLVLRAALARNPAGTILVSTRSRQRLTALAAIAEAAPIVTEQDPC